MFRAQKGIVMDTKTTRRRRSRTSVALAGVGAVAAAMLLTPPTASAIVDGSVVVTPGLSFSLGTAKFGTTCANKVTAKATAAGVVTFSVKSASGTTTPIGTATAGAAGNEVEATWTPTATGNFVISAKEAASAEVSASPVSVGTGINFGGFACLVL